MGDFGSRRWREPALAGRITRRGLLQLVPILIPKNMITSEYRYLERSDRRGFGESFPRAPPGLSRRDWGLDESCAKRVATEGDSGNPFPVPHRGCPVGTGGEVYLSYLELRYSSIAAAALRPAPIARITVAAPVTASPPANMPSLVVRPSASASSPPRRVA